MLSHGVTVAKCMWEGGEGGKGKGETPKRRKRGDMRDRQNPF